MRHISHLNFERKNSVLTVAVTPLSSGYTLLSFEEITHASKPKDDSLFKKLSEVVIRVNSDLMILYVSNNSGAKFGKKSSDLIGKRMEQTAGRVCLQ